MKIKRYPYGIRLEAPYDDSLSFDDIDRLNERWQGLEVLPGWRLDSIMMMIASNEYIIIMWLAKEKS